MSDQLQETNVEYQLVVDKQIFETLITQWQTAAYLAIDTEFIRTNTLLAKPGLVQIADNHGVYLIDPIAINDLSGLVPILENPEIIKVMHAMSEDVELLFHSFGAKIQRVFDTQIAAAFAGIGVSLGYQNLVKEVLGVELDKGETRSDWLQRPLTDSQLMYAALDVIYLMKLYDALRPKLMDLGYLDALYEETRYLTEQSFNIWEKPEQAYLKLRGAWELPESSQRLLQSLVIWRDKTAVSANIPKPWVFDDASLIEIAKQRPRSVHDIKRIKSVSGRSCKQFAESLLNVIKDFEINSTDFQVIDAPLRPFEMPLFKKLKSIVNDVSRETGIPAQLLGSRKMLEALVIQCTRNKSKNMQFTEEYQGWRKPLFEKRFLALFSTSEKSQPDQ